MDGGERRKNTVGEGAMEGGKGGMKGKKEEWRVEKKGWREKGGMEGGRVPRPRLAA